MSADEACPICMEAMVAPFHLPCGHGVHSECMLRWCLRPAAHRCPICRMRADAADSDEDDNDEGNEDDSDEDHDSYVEVLPGPVSPDVHLLTPQPLQGVVPFWRRIREQRVPPHHRLIAWASQQLLLRGRSRGAPPSLRRCQLKHRKLVAKLQEATHAQRGLRDAHARGRIKDVLATVRKQTRAVARAKTALQKHKLAVIQVAQRDPTCHAFLAARPVPEPPWWH